MSTAIDLSVLAGTDPIFTIADEVFAAMIDREPGLLCVWPGAVPPIADAMHAWVDVDGVAPRRVLLSTERDTALLITRALLALDPDEAVDDADFVDALGEVANVVGGNVKALVPDPGPLTLPRVNDERPQTRPESLLHELALAWRGRLLVIGLWSLP